LPLVEKTHNKTAFYKYMPADVAEIVLSNNTLRWSSPLIFNDPFDVPRELAYGLKPQQIKEAIVNHHLELYRNPPNDLSNLHPKMQFLINTIKSARSDKLINKMEDELRNSLSEEAPDSKNLDEFRNRWKNQIQEMRILCLCESHEKTSMWYHYADKYKGAVLEFLCTDDVDTPWRIAKPIEYTDENHLVSTPDGWAKLLNMEQTKALRKIFEASVYTKSTDWSYEHEWRVASFKRPHETGHFSDYPFDGRSIGNLYLGPLISEKTKNSLMQLSSKYPRMNIYQARIGISRKIIYKPIHG
jgi:hypothetical protein